jgi:heme exporter protein D
MIVNLGPYAGFIVAAYGVALATVAALIVWVVADHRSQTRVLADLEARGITRRAGSKLEAA